MEENEIVELGGFAEQVLTHSYFARIVQEFEHRTVHSMLSTKPGQEAEREKIFASFQGAGEFIALLQEFVVQRNKLLQQDETKTEDFDDPSVHDIYREDD